MAHLSRWLERRSLEPAELTPLQVDAYLEDRRNEHTNRLKVSSLRPVLEFLRRNGIVPLCPEVREPSADDELLERYKSHLADERGLVGEVVKMFLGTRRSSWPIIPGLSRLSRQPTSLPFVREYSPLRGGRWRPTPLPAYGRSYGICTSPVWWMLLWPKQCPGLTARATRDCPGTSHLRPSGGFFKAVTGAAGAAAGTTPS